MSSVPEAAVSPPRGLPRVVLAYAVPVAAVAAALALRSTVAPTAPPYLLFLGVVLVSAWVGGLGPGLLATGLAATGIHLVLLPPQGEWAAPAGGPLLGLGLFLVEGTLLSALSARLRSSLHEARQAVDERERRASALRASDARKAAMLESALDCVLVLDHEGRVTETNGSAFAVLGWAPEDLIGQRAADTFIPPRYREGHRRGLARYLERGEGSVFGRRLEMAALRADGEEIPVELAISAVELPGEPPFFVGYLRDITERRRMLSEREDLLRSAQRANAAKDSFLSLLGHELRNPLSAVRNALAAIDRESADAERSARLLEIARRQIAHVGTLVDDLFEVSRAEVGKLRLEIRRIELGRLVEQSVGAARAGASDQHLEFERPEGPVWVDADRTRMRQVLDNLYSNARRASEPGGRIRVRVESDGKEAVIRVRDEGQGIAPEQIEEIFEPYVQARISGGLGLGLPLARLLVEAQDGTLTGESEGLGRGAEFTIRMPERAAPASERTVSPERRTPLTGLRVLLVDDHQDSADSLAMLLERSGCVVDVTYTGEDGLDAAARQRPDAVICDLGLPDFDGCEVARRMRRLEGFESVQIVALTGYAERGVEVEEAGFDAFLAKPVNPARLRRLLGVRAPGESSS